MKMIFRILMFIVLFYNFKLLAQSPAGEYKDIDILKNNDTLVIYKRYGSLWGGITFGLTSNINFNEFYLPRNYNPDKPLSFIDSMVNYPASFGEIGYHAGLRFEFQPAEAYWGAGLDVHFIDYRRTISTTEKGNDALQTGFSSDLQLNYITLNPYVRYNFQLFSKDFFLTGGLDFELKYSSTLTYKKTFVYSEYIDHDRIITENPSSFRFGINLGIGSDIFSADVNKRMRMRISPYFNLHAGTNVFSEFNSSLNMVYGKLGIAIKIGPDIIREELFKWDNTYVLPPQELAAERKRRIDFAILENRIELPLELIIPVSTAFENPPDITENVGASLDTKKQPTPNPQPEKKLQTFASGREYPYYYSSSTSTSLTQEMRKELDKLGEYLIANPNVQIRINGHTDGSGNSADERNLRSQKRAEEARNYLVKNNKIAVKRIFVKSKGALDPLKTYRATDKRQNRIVIEIDPKD